MRTIAIPVDSRANYTRAATIIEAIDQHPDLRCQFIACSKFAYEWQNFTNRKPDNVLVTHDGSDDTPMDMAKSAAHLMECLTECFRSGKPDLIVAMTDRYETLAVATTSVLMNVRVAHVQGGELTGTIDESLRHAVTKLSHLHFTATNEALYNVLSMGESSDTVFNVGCPATDLLLRVDISKRPTEQPYILVLYHPVTTEYEDSYQQMTEVLGGVAAAWQGLIVVVGPNHDAGNHGVWQAIKDAGIAAPHMVPHDEFVKLMAHAEVMVGNSSAGIREACYFGTPVVDVGSRQQGRTPKCKNVEHSRCLKDSISHTILRALLVLGRPSPEQLYGNGTAGQQIASVLASVELPNLQKRFYQS